MSDLKFRSCRWAGRGGCRERRPLRWLAGLLAGLLAESLLSGSADAQPPPAPVVVSPLVKRQVMSGQTFVGTVTPSRRAVVGSAVSGRVVEFPINEGDRVEDGQPLAQLLTATIELELAAAVAELELRQQELLEIRNGTLPEELQRAEAIMLSAQAQREYQAARRKRLDDLFRTGGAAAREERDEAVAGAIDAAQQYRRAAAEHALAVKGPRAERVAQAVAKVAMQQAVVDKLQDQIKKYTMISRFAGYVTAEHTEVGEWLQVGAPVAEIAALDEVDVAAQVVEHQIPFVRLGMFVRVEIPALPDRIFTGVVVSIAPQGDLRSRTFPVKIRVPNEIDAQGPAIKSGMYARALLPTGATQDALLAPKDALVLGGPQPLIYVVGKGADGRPAATPVPVQLGVADGSLIQVEGALSPDAQVIVLGNERLRPGQAVVVARVQDPTADRPTGSVKP